MIFKSKQKLNMDMGFLFPVIYNSGIQICYSFSPQIESNCRLDLPTTKNPHLFYKEMCIHNNLIFCIYS